MSKAGDFIKKVEEEIESIFAGGHEEPADPVIIQTSGSHYVVEEDNLAFPEIHTGKVHPEAGNPEGERPGALPAAENEDGGQEKEEKKKNKISIQYDTVAVPEIHIPHIK